jgi:hypothetical protein
MINADDLNQRVDSAAMRLVKDRLLPGGAASAPTV